MNINLKTLADVPLSTTNQLMTDSWPPFMIPDKVTIRNWNKVREKFPEYQICLFDGNRIIGVANSVPLSLDDYNNDLPMQWSKVLSKGLSDTFQNRNALSAINVAVDVEYQHQGMSQILLKALKHLANQHSFKRLMVPARPTFKQAHPLIPFDHYIKKTRKDGKAFDPWIRTHQKLGGHILRPMNYSFVVKRSVEQWEKWTHQKFNQSKKYVVKGALRPVSIDLTNDIGTYYDPNVWMEYVIK